MLEVLVEGKLLIMEVDKGTEVLIIAYTTHKCVFPELHLAPTTIVLKTSMDQYKSLENYQSLWSIGRNHRS